MKKFLYINILLILLTSACSKDNNPELPLENDKTQIGEKKTAEGLTVTLWSDMKDLLVAYNKLYVTIKNAAGDNIQNATVSYTPVMDMMTMQHSSPVEQPVYTPKGARYEGAVVFSMPSGDMGNWKLTVTVNGEPLVFEVVVKPLPEKVKYTGTFLGSDGFSYSVSLIKPSSPKTGLNDLELLVNRRQNMMSFPPADDLSIELTPEMPSMSHGSPNNVNPVHTAKGHYSGKVNFTMTGDWRLHLRLKKGNTVIIDDASLDLLF